MSLYRILLVASVWFQLFVASNTMSFSTANQYWIKEKQHVTDCLSIETLALKAAHAFPVLASATEIINWFESNDLDVRAEFSLIKDQSVEKVLSPEKAADDPSFIHLAIYLIHDLFGSDAYDTIKSYLYDENLHLLLNSCKPSTIGASNRAHYYGTYHNILNSYSMGLWRSSANILSKLVADKFQGDNCLLKSYLNDDDEMFCKESSDVVEFLKISRTSYNQLKEMSIAVKFFLCQKSDPSHCHVFRIFFSRDPVAPKIFRWRKPVMVVLLDPFYGMNTNFINKKKSWMNFFGEKLW